MYHKYNLWTSELNTFDIDPNGPQLVTVDTPFGRLGLSVCADLIWRSPVVDLVDLAAVDTLLVPLYWSVQVGNPPLKLVISQVFLPLV